MRHYALATMLNKLSRSFVSTRTMIFGLKVNAKLACKLTQKALQKFAQVKAEADNDAKVKKGGACSMFSVFVYSVPRCVLLC